MSASELEVASRSRQLSASVTMSHASATITLITSRTSDDPNQVQVTANSLTGRWGSDAKLAAEWLMKRHGVHVLASDAHGLGSRPPVLSEARVAALQIIGKTAAAALVDDNPRAIVAGESLALID